LADLIATKAQFKRLEQVADSGLVQHLERILKVLQGLCKGGARQGSGVIWNQVPFDTQVIPAKAGIHSPNLRKYAVYGLDSRPSAGSGQAFRGNDCGFQCACLANDTSTRRRGCGAVVSRGTC